MNRRKLSGKEVLVNRTYKNRKRNYGNEQIFLHEYSHVSSASASLPSLISSLTLLDNISRSVYIKVPAMAGLSRFPPWRDCPGSISYTFSRCRKGMVHFGRVFSYAGSLFNKIVITGLHSTGGLESGAPGSLSSASRGRMRSCQAWNICREVPGILSDSPPLRLFDVSCGFDITIYQIHRKRRRAKDYLSTDFSSFLISSASQCLIRV